MDAHDRFDPHAGSLDLVALIGASENEVVVLAELHRNPRVHIVGVYDPSPEAVGHELAEILGLRHGGDRTFLEQIAAAPIAVIPRDRHRFAEAIALLRERGCEVLDQNAALARFMVSQRVEQAPIPALPAAARADVAQLEDTVRWLEKALDREALLRSLLSISVQAVDADKGSVQLFDPFAQQLYIAYAEGLSDHTVRASRQCLGEGIAGRVAATRRAELLQGSDVGPDLRDRPDIQSSICAPLQDQGELLGVINVSTDWGSRRLERTDLDCLVRMSARIAPVLRRLLQIQSLLDRALVEDLERELDAVLDLDPPVVEGLSLVRDLVQDLSGAQSAALVVIGEDGPALQLHPGRDADGRPLASRDVDATQGILGQVLLDGSPVMLEEKNRRAGESTVRREVTLYIPLGGREAFSVLLLRFGGLSTLSHFQRNLDRVKDILTPRLGILLARHESAQRHERLRRLASGLAQLVRTPEHERLGRAATLFMDLCGAEAVALWRPGSDIPDSELRQTLMNPGTLDPVWEQLRARLRRGGPLRLRELEPAGSDLRSLLLVGEGDGPALAALNRRPEDDLAEWGFRNEDVEAALLLLDSVGVPAPMPTALDQAPPFAAPAPTPTAAATPAGELGERLLEEAVERELHRAQRYHLGFSLNVFRFEVDAGFWATVENDVRRQVEQTSRTTDAVLWLSDQRLAILAPEEMRGQRRLVRRVRDLLEAFLRDRLGAGPDRVDVRTATYPRDVQDAAGMLARCLDSASRPHDTARGGD